MDSLIPARGMGNYINDDPDASTQRNRVYHKCACGGLMSEYAELCRPCNRKKAAREREAVNDAERLRIRRERQPRWEAAIAAGWTEEELFPRRDKNEYVEGESDVDPLPTWGEIKRRVVANLIQAWWKETGEHVPTK